MQTKVNPNSITECLRVYHNETLLNERTDLKNQLRKSGNLLAAVPMQERLTIVEKELAYLKAESVLQSGDFIG